jgi:hypothetical protein
MDHSMTDPVQVRPVATTLGARHPVMAIQTGTVDHGATADGAVAGRPWLLHEALWQKRCTGRLSGQALI